MALQSHTPMTANLKQKMPPLHNLTAQRPPPQLSNGFKAWYGSDTDDLIYKQALDACLESKIKLAKYLTPDDIHLLEKTATSTNSAGFNALAVEQFIQERYSKATKSLEGSKIKWLSEATYSFASVATQLSEILAPLVPQSPEYTIPFGCLMIVFEMLVAKKEKREQAMAVFDKLLQKLPSLELYRVALPSPRIKRQLVQTYVDILTLIVCVTEWCAIGRLSKLVDVMAPKPKYDFDAGLRQIEESHKALRTLVKDACTAILVDSNEALKNQSQMIDYIADHSEYLAAHITTLNHAVEALQENQSKTQLVQTIHWCGELIDALLPGTWSEWEETSMWEQREFHMAPKDHWEVNGILDYLKAWRDLPDASVLAIFGPSKNRDTWVTEFSLDMIQACRLQGDLVASVMCERPDGQTFTPTTMVKKLTCQLLEQNPRLILEAPDILNIRTCRAIQGLDHACLLFESLVARLTVPLFVIIDRIDCCEVEETDVDECQRLLEFLSRLVKGYSPERRRIIITSGDDPPEGDSLSPELAISTCTIASRVRPVRREADRPARSPVTFYVVTLVKDDVVSRQAVGLHNLYRMSGSMQNRFNSIAWRTKLVPTSPRQKMICRHFGLRHLNDKSGGIRLYDREDLR